MRVAVSMFGAVQAIVMMTLIAACAATTPVEIERLRLHADAGRDADAMASLRTLAQAGSVHGQRAIGEVLLHANTSKQTADALYWLQRASEQGDAQATLLLGKTWLYGAPGLPPDGVKARRWFERIGAERAPQAAYYLGLIEKNGYGTPVNFDAAEKHFRFAAERGVVDAMYQLGNTYASGEGVDLDPREAMRWYLRAAAQDHPQAIQELANAFTRGDTLLPQSDFQADQMRRAVEHALRHPKAAP